VWRAKAAVLSGVGAFETDQSYVDLFTVSFGRDQNSGNRRQLTGNRKVTLTGRAKSVQNCSLRLAMICHSATYPSGISSIDREPIAAWVVYTPDAECPQPPSPRFPVWKPRYLDGGVFPLDRHAAACQ
jgi:hypothetical protein